MDDSREPSPQADPTPSELAAVEDPPTHPLQGTVDQWNQQFGIGKITYKRRGPDGIERDERLTVHHSGLIDRANLLEEGCTVYFDMGTTKRKGQVVPAAINVSGPGAVFSPEKAAEVDDLRRRGRSGFSDVAAAAESRERDYDRQPQQADAPPAPHSAQQVAPTPAVPLLHGLVSRWFEGKRYGFIQSRAHPHDLFFDADNTTPYTASFYKNDRVSFKIVPNEHLAQGEEAVQVSAWGGEAHGGGGDSHDGGGDVRDPRDDYWQDDRRGGGGRMQGGGGGHLPGTGSQLQGGGGGQAQGGGHVQGGDENGDVDVEGEEEVVVACKAEVTCTAEMVAV